MSRRAHVAIFALASVLWCASPASADTLRCQSINGNTNCAGSDGVSCQTVNGKKTCISGHGDVVQSFGKGTSSNSANPRTDDGADADGDDPDAAKTSEATHEHVEQHGPGGRTMIIDRNGSHVQLHTDRLSIDRN